MRNLLISLILVFTLPAMGTTKHLVFNIDSVLVKGIPQRNYNAFSNKDQMIKVDEGGRSYYFYIYPHISYLLDHLAKNDKYVIHFATHNSQSFAHQVLSAIRLPKLSAESKVLNQNHLVKGKINLKFISKDLTNVVFFTGYQDVVVPEQKNNEIFLGPSYFYFEDYAMAQSERNKASPEMQKNFPASYEEWETEQNKVAYIYQLLLETKAATSDNLANDLKAYKANQIEMTREGRLVARYKFQEQFPRLKYTSDMKKVIGCGTYHVRTETYINNLPLADCLQDHPIRYHYNFDKGHYRAESCHKLDGNTGAFIKVVDEDICYRSHLTNFKYYWQGEKKLLCGAYLDLYFIKNADPEKCGYEHLIKKGKEYVITSSYLESVLSLMDGEEFNPSLLKQNDSHIIAVSLIKRQHERYEKHDREEKPDMDFMNDTRIGMAFNFTLLESIKKNCFLNQHQTNTSKGVLNPTRRLSRESALF